MEGGGGWAVLLQQCHPNSAESLVIARRTEWKPHCFCCFLCVVSYPPNWGKRPRYIDRLLFMNNFAIIQVLQAVTWQSQTTFIASYLRDVTLKTMDTFSIGAVVPPNKLHDLLGTYHLIPYWWFCSCPSGIIHCSCDSSSLLLLLLLIVTDHRNARNHIWWDLGHYIDRVQLLCLKEFRIFF